MFLFRSPCHPPPRQSSVPHPKLATAWGQTRGRFSSLCFLGGALLFSSLTLAGSRKLDHRDILRSPYRMILPNLGVMDQKDLPMCTAFSLAKQYENYIFAHMGTDVKISIPAIVLDSIVTRYLEVLFFNAPLEDLDTLGSNCDTPQIIPDSAYSPLCPIHQWNEPLLRLRKMAASALRQIERKGVPQKQLALKRRFADEGISFLKHYLGWPKDTFNFNGKNYTLNEFHAEFLSSLPLLLVERKEESIREGSDITSFSKAYDRAIRGSPPGHRSLTTNVTSFHEVEALIREGVESGTYPALSFLAERRAISHKHGILALRPFGIQPSWFTPESRHRAIIVGYGDASDGTLGRLRLLNSWGKSKGKGGEYDMYADYFRASFLGLWLLPPPTRPCQSLILRRLHEKQKKKPHIFWENPEDS